MMGAIDVLYPTLQITLAFNSSQQLIFYLKSCVAGVIYETWQLKYGIKVVSGGLARYLEYYDSIGCIS